MASTAPFRPNQLRWLFGLTACLVLALMALGGRLYVLQVLRHDELRGLAESLTRRATVREPWRGDIRDVNGNPLATSHPVKRLCADPSLIRDRQWDVARALSPILGRPETELAERLKIITRVDTNGVVRTNQFVDLRFEATLDQWTQVTQAMAQVRFEGDEAVLPKRERRFWNTLRQQAIFGLDSQRRSYPNGQLASHVIGVVGITNYTLQDTWIRELVGAEGIEASFNKQLSGVRGIRVTEKDRNNREIVRFRGQNAEPVAGLNVVLTVDLVLQRILEAELAEAVGKFRPENAMGIIVRPRTGEILAMANSRTFDPNDLSASTVQHRRNRIITDFYEPGSTFKVVSLSSALSQQVARLTDSFDCEHGSWRYGGLVLTDHEHYGVLPLETVFAKSSNIGMAKLALRMSETNFHRQIRAFGFGSRTGIELPGEVMGRLREPKSLAQDLDHSNSDWIRDRGDSAPDGDGDRSGRKPGRADAAACGQAPGGQRGSDRGGVLPGQGARGDSSGCGEAGGSGDEDRGQHEWLRRQSGHGELHGRGKDRHCVEVEHRNRPV